jgi:actin-related protein 10
VRTCFVTSLNRATQLKAVEPPPDVVYREGGIDVFHIPGKVREAAYEVLFEQDNDQTSISTMILDAIIKAKFFNSISLTILTSKLKLTKS